MISKEQFINEVIRIASQRGYKIESNARSGLAQIDFGNKKLHTGHLASLFPVIISDNVNIPSVIDQVALGRPCTHKPMREIIEQMRVEKLL